MTEDRGLYTVTPTEACELPGRILAILVAAKANHTRVTAKQLMRHFHHNNDRKVRLAIGKLILKGYTVVSSIRQPYGYWLADSKAEVEEYVRTQYSRMRETAATVRQVQLNAARAMSDYEQIPFVIEETTP